MTDENLVILSINRDMHENTFVENTNASTTNLLPLNSFTNLEVRQKFTLE